MFLLKRVARKGCGSKEIFSVGERCLVQNVVTKLWDREAIIKGLRTAADNTIVSYNIDIAGVKSTRHWKFLRKLIMNDKNEDYGVVVKMSDEFQRDT